MGPRLALVTACLVSAGCAGARHDVRFETADYPISLTSVLPVRAEGDAKPRHERGFQSLGRLHASKVGRSILWTMVPLNRVDFSGEVNEQVAALGGDGIVNLRISAGDTGFGIFGIFSFLHWLPFWPGDVAVTIDGDIVALRQEPKPTVASDGSQPSS